MREDSYIDLVVTAKHGRRAFSVIFMVSCVHNKKLGY